MITAKKELAWTVVRAFQFSPGVYREIELAFEQNSVCEMYVSRECTLRTESPTSPSWNAHLFAGIIIVGPQVVLVSGTEQHGSFLISRKCVPIVYCLSQLFIGLI
jgi:hypothetical protein